MSPEKVPYERKLGVGSSELRLDRSVSEWPQREGARRSMYETKGVERLCVSFETGVADTEEGADTKEECDTSL